MTSRIIGLGLLLGLVLFASCSSHRCRTGDGQPLVLRYSQMKVQPSQDAAGNFVISPFPGPVVAVKAVVRSVWLSNQSYSIASETSVAWIELLPEELIPADTTRTMVELHFDQYGLWM